MRNLLQVMGHYLTQTATRNGPAPAARTVSDCQTITQRDLMDKLNVIEEQLKAIS